MNNLVQQVQEKNFKNSNFTVYSIVEEDGFISELNGMFGEKYTIDELEYIILDLSVKEKNALFYRMSIIMDKIIDLKRIIEKESQKDGLKPKSRVIVNKDKMFILVVKLKEFDLQGMLSKMTNDDKQVCSSSI